MMGHLKLYGEEQWNIVVLFLVNAFVRNWTTTIETKRAPSDYLPNLNSLGSHPYIAAVNDQTRNSKKNRFLLEKTFFLKTKSTFLYLKNIELQSHLDQIDISNCFAGKKYDRIEKFWINSNKIYFVDKLSTNFLI